MKYVLPLLARKFGSFGPGRISRLHLPIALAAVMAMGGPDATAQAPALQVDWIQSPINGHWYGVDYTARTWTDSEALAVSLGGHLVTIRSQAEQDWIEANFSPYLTPDGFWIGFNDVAVEGVFVWSSGEPPAYTNWYPGEPNDAGAGEDFGTLFGTGLPQPWKWNDWPNDLPGNNISPLFENSIKPFSGWSWPQTVPTGARPTYGALADFDGDGDLDYASPDSLNGEGSAPDQVSIYWNDGTGTFLPGPVVVVPGEPRDLVSVDHDQDGDMDLVVACFDGTTLGLIDNTGGQFAGVTAIDTGGRYHGVSVADLDGDGIDDLMVTTAVTSDSIRTYMGQVGGGFSSPTIVAGWSGFIPRHCTLSDYDGDGDIDAAVDVEGSKRVDILLNDSHGGMTVSASLSVPFHPGPYRASAVDVDGDGDDDLAIPVYASGSLEIWTNDGLANFVQSATYPVGAGPVSSFAVDFDGDGDSDIAVASSVAGEIRVLWNDGSGGFLAYESFAGLGAVGHVLAGDLDLNGVPDLLGVSTGSAMLTTWVSHALFDCNSNGIQDALDIGSGVSLDCNSNGVPDECDIASGYSIDINLDGLPDECVAPPLMADTYDLSVAAGGVQTFTLTAPYALDFYLLLGTTSGTSPGISVGGFVVPLNYDGYLQHTAMSPNSPPLSASFGVLSPSGSSGTATASFTLPPAFSPALVGMTAHHAYVTIDLLSASMTFVSNAVPLALVP